MVSKKFIAVLWKFLERFFIQFTQFAIQIILARLLLPSDYGTIAIVTVLISMLSVFIQTGLTSALIQGKSINKNDFSSVFFLNIILAFILYIFLFLLAPSIAGLYDKIELVLIIRIMSLSLFLGAINSVQNAVISRNLLFKKSFISNSIAILISGTIGVLFAINGFGVWSLVYYNLSNALVITIIMWYTVKWRPHVYFSFSNIKPLFLYGWKVLASNLLAVLSTEAQTLVIGKIWSVEMVGFFNRGIQFPKMITKSANETIKTVLLPLYSKEQENKKKIKRLMTTTLEMNTFIIAPALIGLFVLSEPIVLMLLTEKWSFSIPFIQIFSIIYLVDTLRSVFYQAINAIGRSDIVLKLVFINVLIIASAILAGAFLGIYYIAYGTLLMQIIGFVLVVYTTRNYFYFSFVEVLKSIIPSLVISIFMGIIVYYLGFLFNNIYIGLAIQISSGIVIYIILSFVFKIKALLYILNSLKSLYLDVRKG